MRLKATTLGFAFRLTPTYASAFRRCRVSGPKRGPAAFTHSPSAAQISNAWIVRKARHPRAEPVRTDRDGIASLERLRGLNEEIFVPGHGAICGKEYLDEQGSFIEEWKAYVRSAIDRGMSKDEAIVRLTDLTDRYPMDVGQDGMAPMVMKRNVANLYDYLTGAWTPV
mgnify:CR=1 FL=1